MLLGAYKSDEIFYLIIPRVNQIDYSVFLNSVFQFVVGEKDDRGTSQV